MENATTGEICFAKDQCILQGASKFLRTNPFGGRDIKPKEKDSPLVLAVGCGGWGVGRGVCGARRVVVRNSSTVPQCNTESR